MKKSNNDQIQWLLVVVSGLAIICLVLLYFVCFGGVSYGELVKSLIPSAIVVLAAFPVAYYVLYRKGISNKCSSKYPELVEEIVSAVSALGASKDPSLDGVVSFYSTFREIEWKNVLSKSNSTIDIVVFYFHSWVNAHYDAIVDAFKRGISFRIVLSDPTSSSNLDNISRLFPEYTKDELLKKIEMTYERFDRARMEAGAHKSKLSVYHVHHLLNYSAQIIDSKFVIVSLFEMYREGKIDSPAIVIDLKKEKNRAFWDKEIAGLVNNSRKVF